MKYEDALTKYEIPQAVDGLVETLSSFFPDIEGNEKFKNKMIMCVYLELIKADFIR